MKQRRRKDFLIGGAHSFVVQDIYMEQTENLARAPGAPLVPTPMWSKGQSSCIQRRKSILWLHGKVMSFVLDHKQSELVTRWGSYAVRCIVSRYDSQIYHSECRFVVALSSALYAYYFEYLAHILFAWTSYVNDTILRTYSRNGHTCISSQYQAVFLLQCSLGMRLACARKQSMLTIWAANQIP